MADILKDGLLFCQCCTLAAVNGDSCDCPGDHDGQVTRGLGRLTTSWRGYIVAAFDEGEGVHEFSSSQCDCCLSRLAGSRHEFAIIG